MDDLEKLYKAQESGINVSVWVEIDGVEEDIFTMYDVYANPFKLGDVIHVNVEEFFPRDLERYKKVVKESFTKTNNERIKKFHLKEVELIKEGKYIRTKGLDKPRLNIEYFGKFV
tara:strand:- start:1793 stop:2137 length:345 start_codon:yes stop_codon:yes gene_type:complete